MSDTRDPSADAAFRLRRRVTFAETDTAGIVHFSNYFRYFEDAEHALWREAGLRVHAPDGTIGWPRISASCDYHRALRFEEEFEVRLAIAEITSRTIRYSGTITRAGERVASGAWKTACVQMLPGGGMRSTNIPPEIAERLAPFRMPSDHGV